MNKIINAYISTNLRQICFTQTNYYRFVTLLCCGLYEKEQKLTSNTLYNSPTKYKNTFLVSSCSCLCPIQWGQVWSREWKYSWSCRLIWIAETSCPVHNTETYAAETTMLKFRQTPLNLYITRLLVISNELWKPKHHIWTHPFTDIYIACGKMPGEVLSEKLKDCVYGILLITQYTGLCVFSLPSSLAMVERIKTLSYYHNQIQSMNYHPLFRSWNNGMRCMFLYITVILYEPLKDQ